MVCMGGCCVMGIVVEDGGVVGEVKAKCSRMCACSTPFASVWVRLGPWVVV
jgi:hypothetical protein